MGYALEEGHTALVLEELGETEEGNIITLKVSSCGLVHVRSVQLLSSCKKYVGQHMERTILI